MIDSAASIDDFIEALRSLRFKGVFNPYTDACPDYDKNDGPAIRRNNLKLVLQAATFRGVDSLWVARDLGYRGGRRTGLALTDETHLVEHAALVGSPRLSRATHGPAVSERTATVIWRVLREVKRPVFLWNVFPLHPHDLGDAHSNRPHTRAERIACKPFLDWLLLTLRPRTVVAIGRDAQLALADIDIAAEKVRHPSYGGQAEFIDGVHKHYGMRPRMSQSVLI